MRRKRKFKEIARMWKEDKENFVKKSTISAYSLLLKNHILPAFGEHTDIRENEVQSFVISKIAIGLSQKSVRDMVTVMKMIIRFGVKKDMMPMRQIDVRFPTERKRQEIEVLSKGDQRHLMKYLRENFSFKNFGLLLCLSAGMRIGEVCALTWDDLDITRGIINISKTVQRIYLPDGKKGHTELVVGPAKSASSIRSIPMTRDVIRMIKPWKRIVLGNHYVLTNSPFPTEPRTYRNHYKRLMQELGLPEMKFHGLRHSFATRCIESECDYKTVSVLLGHSNIGTTLNIYVHPGMEQKKKCMEQMSRALR